MSETINNNLIAVLSARRANGFAIGNTGTRKNTTGGRFWLPTKTASTTNAAGPYLPRGRRDMRTSAGARFISTGPQRGQGTDGLRSGHTLGISAMPDRPCRNVQVQEGAHGRQEQSGGKGILAEARQVKRRTKDMTNSRGEQVFVEREPYERNGRRYFSYFS